MSSNDVFRQVAPPRNGGFTFVAGDGHCRFAALLGIHVYLDIENYNGTEETHPLFSDGQQLSPILRKFNPLHRRIKFQDFDTFPRPNVP